MTHGTSKIGAYAIAPGQAVAFDAGICIIIWAADRKCGVAIKET